ncbi:MAG: Ig-like domain-containing protein, partial [Nitrospirota bacterium]
GKASDAGSGVASVQVGITPSGGTITWYPAKGTTSWSYKWPLPANNGSYTIQARATDKAGNTGDSSDQVNVTISQ